MSKKQKHILHHFDKIWFRKDSEYFIFLIWATFVAAFLTTLI